jgi:hypothetical protein
MFMPFLAEIAVSGSGPGVDEVDQITAALAAALEQGWESRWRVVRDDHDEDGDLDADGDGDHEVERRVLDHRILGYPGGGFVLVVLGGDGLTFEEAALAAATLGRHLTSWSPGLMACSVDSVKVSPLESPYDGEDWLPPIADTPEDTTPSFPLVEHMDSDLQSLAAKYLLAGAVRSLWSPGQRVNNRSWLIAREVVLGAAQHPWGRELTSALGTLLIKAARYEEESGGNAPLAMTQSGSMELAADLLERARASVDEDDNWDDDDYDLPSDEFQGHELIESFTAAHDLQWDQYPDGEPQPEADKRSDRQLRQLLWAGLNALSTLCASSRAVTNPWMLLTTLDDDPAIALMSRTESARIEDARESDAESLRDAGYACALAWLAIRRPDVIDRPRGGEIVEAVAQARDDGASPFRMLTGALYLMIGPEPIRAALAELDVPVTTGQELEDFLRAQDVTCSDEADGDERGDAYDDMNRALDNAFEAEEDPSAAIRLFTALLHRAAELTSTEVNPRRGEKGHISSAADLSTELLKNAAMHATLMLSQDDDEDSALRLYALGLTAWADPNAAGTLASELPDLTGPDPRTAPAARRRALQWVADAHDTTNTAGKPHHTGADVLSPDARTVLDHASGQTEGEIDDWDIKRLVHAAAQAAAAVLAAGSVDVDDVIAVFADSGPATDWDSEMEYPG